MRKALKTGTAVFLTASMIFSLCGCGKSEKKEETTEKTYAEAEVIEDNEEWVTTEEEVVEDERFTTVEGADVMGFDFEDGEVGKFVTYTNGGAYELYVEDGSLVCDIERTGTVEHGCQVYYDGFTMAKGCEYTMSFDISSTVERTVQWRVQINGGDYHLYGGEYITIGPEPTHVETPFVMEDNSDPAPRFVINMGAIEGDGELGAHKISIDNVSLFVTDSSNAEKIEGAPTPLKVKVNQVGYHPEDVKTVITTSSKEDKFKIVKADTEETVYIGKYSDALVFDAATGQNVWPGDFSDFQSPGKYKIVSSPSGESYEFEIGTDIYGDVYKDTILALYSQRCGTDLDSEIIGDYAHEACHMDEATVYDNQSLKVDVSGGWHDAGDFGRYVVPGAKSVMDLMLVYEDYNYDADDIGIPESGNKIPDVLDEAKYELDWMLKMQDEVTGGVYHKVTCLVFPETVLATEEKDELFLAPISFAATADFAAVMAKASVVYKEFDSEFADKCLEASKKAYDYMKANYDMKGYKNPEEIVTGEYDDSKLDDEKLWAAAELYIATKDDTYKTDVEATLAEDFRDGLGWADIGTYPLYSLASAKDIDESISKTATDKLIELADSHVEDCKEEAFSVGIGTKYVWGSNMTVTNYAGLLMMANNISPNEDYVTYAQKHRDYVLGVNGVAYCYLTGYGTLSPEHIHHRTAQVKGRTIPGLVVGGANENREDPYATAVLFGYPAMLSYVDNEQSYSCNEVTIYWNSSFTYMLGGLIANQR